MYIENFPKKLDQKKKDNRGFSLSELLVTVIIVSLLSVMIVTGVRTALYSHRKVTEEANAEVLLSTCVTMLRNELSTATDIQVLSDTKTITYQKGGSGIKSSLRSGMSGSAASTTEPEQIYHGSVGINSEDGSESISNETLLISSVTATEGLFISYEEISYADGVVTVTGLSVRKKDSDRKLSELGTLIINCM